MPVIRGGALLRHPKRPNKGGTLGCVVVSRNDGTTRYLLTAGHVISLNGYAKVENLLNQTFYENGFRGAGGTFLSGLRVMFR